MDEMINNNLIKRLRNQRAWSQEQLASISGLSLRTVQRIENEGKCSLDSKRALAAALDLEANELSLDLVASAVIASNDRGRKFGYGGVIIGLICSYTGITMSLLSGGITSGEAGEYYGVVGAFVGVSFAVIGALSNRYRAHTA